MSEFKYKFLTDHLPWMENQVWEMKEQYGGASTYDKLAPYEVSQIEEHLPKCPDRILELGAGLGRGSIYLRHYYKEKEITFPPCWVLADRDGESKENTGAFAPKEDEYYNDFKLARSFCRLNGLDNFKFFDTEKDDWDALGTFDFIFSFCSFGMHVPIERYIDKILSVCNDNTVLIFGTRHAGYSDKSFSDKFREVIFKPSLGQAPFPVEHWLILKGKK